MRHLGLGLGVLLLSVTAFSAACSAFGGSDTASGSGVGGDGNDAGSTDHADGAIVDAGGPEDSAMGDAAPAVEAGTTKDASTCSPTVYSLTSCNPAPALDNGAGTVAQDPTHSPTNNAVGAVSCKFAAASTMTFTKAFVMTPVGATTTLDFQVYPSTMNLDIGIVGCSLGVIVDKTSGTLSLSSSTGGGTDLGIDINGTIHNHYNQANDNPFPQLQSNAWNKVTLQMNPTGYLLTVSNNNGDVTKKFTGLVSPAVGPGTITLTCGVTAPASPLTVYVDSINLTTTCN